MAGLDSPSASIRYVEDESDPRALIVAGRNALEGLRIALDSDIVWDGAQLAAAQRQLILMEKIVVRLRVLMAMQGSTVERVDAVADIAAQMRKRDVRVQGGIPE